MILLTAILLILLEGIYEGLKTRGKHIASASVEFVFLALVTTLALAFISGRVTPFDYLDIPFWKIMLGYLFLRIGLFDLVWNLSAGKGIYYIGKTKLYDKFWGWLIDRGKIAMILILFLRFIFVCISVVWLLNYGQ